MAVIKEWKCERCGYFDSEVPVCPTCGGENVMRVFLTPPGFKGDKTKLVDDQIESFTKRHNLTNFSNNLSTKHDAKPKSIWEAIPRKGSDKKQIDLSGELARVVGGGLEIDQLKPSLPGQYEATYHAEDPALKERHPQ